MPTFRVLVVGVGSIGERHVRCFQHTQRTHISICETNNELARQIADRYAIQDVYSDYAQALSNGTPDAVVIATPAPWHVPMAREAVERHMHALIEKPLSISFDGIPELIQAAAAQSVVTMVAYVLRCHPALESMQRAMASGIFGQPKHLYVTAGQHFPTYRPAYRQIYYRSRESGGGAIQDSLTHAINAAEWLVGPIQRVVADAQHLLLPDVDVEDTVNVIAQHASVMSAFCFNQHQAPNESTITVVCDTGTARFESHHARWSWMTSPETEWKHETVDGLERDMLFVRQAHRFLDAIEFNAPVPCTLGDAWQTLRVNLALLRSAEDQQKWTETSHEYQLK